MNKRQKEALQHKNVLGAGAAKRRQLLSGDEVWPVIMEEFARGTLHSGSGEIVKKKPQAKAIALSEAGSGHGKGNRNVSGSRKKKSS